MESLAVAQNLPSLFGLREQGRFQHTIEEYYNWPMRKNSYSISIDSSQSSEQSSMVSVSRQLQNAKLQNGSGEAKWTMVSGVNKFRLFNQPIPNGYQLAKPPPERSAINQLLSRRPFMPRKNESTPNSKIKTWSQPKNSSLYGTLVKKCQSIQLCKPNYHHSNKKVQKNKFNMEEQRKSFKKGLTIVTRNLQIIRQQKENQREYVPRKPGRSLTTGGNEPYLSHFVCMKQFGFMKKRREEEAKKDVIIQELEVRAIKQIRKQQFFEPPEEQERILHLRLRERIKSDIQQQKILKEHDGKVSKNAKGGLSHIKMKNSLMNGFKADRINKRLVLN